MNKPITLLSIFIWSALITFCYASPLKIEISLNEHSPQIQFYKDSSFLALSTKIINISHNYQKISFWQCTYGASWVASSSAIVSGLESCTQNFPADHVLKPKESYSSDLIIAVSSKAKAGPMTFQMGFNLKNDWFGSRIGIESNKEMLKDVIWSNPITIEITNDMITSLHSVSDTLELKSKYEFELHGVKSQCTIDDECWCRNFNGSYFIEGKNPNTCNKETHFCAECVYK